jgi:AcrR family transcriptional regulator
VTSTDERIRQAALRLFATKGFSGTGIRDIATEAGITTASLYHYMGTKDDLLVRIMEYGLQRLTDAATRTIDVLEHPHEQLAGLVRLHVWTHGVRQQSALVVDTEIRSLSGEHLDHIRDLRDAYEGIWRGVIARGVERGTMHVEDPKLASFALLEMCTGVSHWFSPTGELTLAHICRVYADMALALVAARVRGRPVRADQLVLPEPAEVYPAEAPEVSALP